MSGFFSSLKDKAQSAVSSSGFGRGDGGESASSAQSSGGVGGFIKARGLESFTHQLRSFQQQYSSSTTPVQKIITTGKGIAIDYDNVSRDAQAHSKEMYLWGQTEADDIKDVTDRLGWLSYVHGSLAETLATNIDKSRTSFKHLRDAENALTPRRNIRIGLQNQIARIEHDQRKDQQQKLADLKVQLQRNEEEDETAERDIELLKRKAIRESEQEKWAAIREYAEKLSMVAQAALSIVPAQGPLPPTKAQPYTGSLTTASVRASLQKALDGYSPGNIGLIVANPTSSDLKHTRSFGETHAKELLKIGSTEPVATTLPITPPPTSAAAPPPASSTHHVTFSQSPPLEPVHVSPTLPVQPSPLHISGSPSDTATSPANVSPPLNPANLNQAPAPIPFQTVSTSPVAVPDPSDPSTKIPTVTPTVAETGVPQVAGPDGPGPKTGSLLDKKVSSPTTSPIASLPPPKFESAEDEKKRLEREDRERVLHEGASKNPFESAEEEKKRLEREERERLLQADGSSGAGHQPPKDHEDDGELPPYQEF